MIVFGRNLPLTSRGLASVGDLVSQMYRFKTELASTKPKLNSRPKPQLHQTTVGRSVVLVDKMSFNFEFCIFDSNFQVSTFKFPLSSFAFRFRLSSFRCQVFTFKFRISIPTFRFPLSSFHFQISHFDSNFQVFAFKFRISIPTNLKCFASSHFQARVKNR